MRIIFPKYTYILFKKNKSGKKQLSFVFVIKVALNEGLPELAIRTLRFYRLIPVKSVLEKVLYIPGILTCRNSKCVCDKPAIYTHLTKSNAVPDKR